MLLRVMVMLLLPVAAHGSAAGVMHSALIGGSRAYAIVQEDGYAPGQEVYLEIYATSDRPGAKETFVGRARGKAGLGGKVKLVLISDPLPKADFEWKIRYVFLLPDGKTPSVSDFTARRNR